MNSEGFKAWLKTTDDRLPLSNYMTVLEGTAEMWAKVEIELAQLKESGIAMVKSNEQIRADRTALQERIKFLEEKVADYKDRLKAALMKPQWDRKQK